MDGFANQILGSVTELNQKMDEALAADEDLIGANERKTQEIKKRSM